MTVTSIVKADDVELTVTQMNSELEQSGVVTSDEAAATTQGEDSQVAGSMATQAAMQAHPQDLKDKDPAVKVNEADKEMPVEERESREMETEQKQIESVRNETGKGYFPEERQSGRSMGARQGRMKK